DDPHQLHHSAIFVCEDVAVKHIAAGKVDEPASKLHIAGCNRPVVGSQHQGIDWLCRTGWSYGLFQTGRDIDDVVPDRVRVLDGIDRIDIRIEYLDDLKRVDVNVERVRNARLV